jgi:hypothetical protein
MKIKRDIALIKSVCKIIDYKNKENKKRDKLYDALCNVLKPMNRTIDEVKKSELTDKQYKIVVDYIVFTGTQLYLYDNLR